jgi:HEPN domain-containing protein
VQIERLHKRLAVLDLEFRAASVPITERALEAFKAVHGSVREQTQRAQLFDPINAWYSERYGEKVLWKAVLGRVPVLVKGELYLAAIKFVEQDVVADYRECIEGLPSAVSTTLDLDDFKNIASYTARAQMYLNALYTLQADDCFLSKMQLELIQRARFNLRIAPLMLKEYEDTQGSIFNAHEAAEKFLKAALVGIDKTKNPIDYRHKLDKLHDELVMLDPRFRSLGEASDALKYILGAGMKIRYETLSRSIEEGVSTFYAALGICSAVANILRFDDERGSNRSAFRAGEYYVNSQNICFWCLEASAGNARLIAFDKGGLRGLSPKDISLKQTESGYYLRVSDKLRVADMGQTLARQIATSHPLGVKEADEVSSVRGKEGAYILGFSRRKL